MQTGLALMRRNAAPELYCIQPHNDTTVGWILNGDAATLEQALEYFDCEPFGLANAMLRAALFSVANTCMLPRQDLLWLDSAHRMTVPGESDGRWRRRFDAQMLCPECVVEIAALVCLSDRTVKPAVGSLSAVEVK